MKGIKKFAVVALATVMTVASTCTAFAATGSPTTSVTPVVEKVTVTVSEDAPKAKVTTSKKGTATINTLGTTTAEKVTVASKVKIDGVSYTVTTLGAGTFAKCGDETTKVALPKTITTIGAKAFTGSSLETVELYSTKTVTVSKTAFKGVNTKSMTIKVSKKMSNASFKKLQKALKAAGYKGKIVRMKSH